MQRLREKEILNRLAVLILRGSIKDGETARVVLNDQNKVAVLANHTDSDLEDDEDMIDEDDAMLEIEDAASTNGDMDLYE